MIGFFFYLVYRNWQENLSDANIKKNNIFGNMME